MDVARRPREEEPKLWTKSTKKHIKAIRARVHPRTLEAEVERPAGRLLEAVVGARAAATDIAADIFAVGFWKRRASEREPTCNSSGQIVTMTTWDIYFKQKATIFLSRADGKKQKKRSKTAHRKATKSQM